MTKINCKCGNGCDYEASTYEKVNKLDCNNSRMPTPCNQCNSSQTQKQDDNGQPLLVCLSCGNKQVIHNK